MKLLGSPLATLPMEQNLKLTPSSGELLKDPTKYKRLVGHLIYLTFTRPNITYFVHVLMQFMNQPFKPHSFVVVRGLRYLKGTPRQGLFFQHKMS